MTTDVREFFKRLADWGFHLIRPSTETLSDRILEIHLARNADSSVLVGRLSCEQGKFVFRYDSDYQGRPIFAFPWVDEEYRSEYLWPFFAVRIPPFNRADVRKRIQELSLKEDQTLEILGSIARISATNPYELKLA